MRRWIIGITTTLVVIAIVVVTRARFATPDAEALEDRHPEVAEARALLRARNDTLQAWMLAWQRARVLAAVGTMRPSSAAFALESRGSWNAATLAAFRAAFEAELDSLPVPQVPLRVLLLPDTGRTTGAYSSWFLRPRRAGEPCTVVLHLIDGPDQTYAPRRDVDRLGVCGLYAAAGMPGPGIAAWLDTTRSKSALGHRPSAPSENARTLNRALGGYILSSLPVVACASGRDEACGPALLDPASGRRRLPTVASAAGIDERAFVQAYVFEMNDFPGEVVAQLRQALGEARFTQWWASELGPAEAYEALSGEPFAAFAQRYLKQHVGTRQPGPLHAGLPLALGMLLAVGLAYWAIRATPRARS